jgi:methionyl-tRNA formyltransferase
MGTPMFALPTLQALIDSPHEVVAVYSQPPRPAGRGQKLTASPVHQIAEKHSIAVFTPTSLKSPEVQDEFRALNADAAIVAAYGLLLPKAILEGTRLGCINVHPSLLPRWRGAAPIPRTLMAGDAQTGVCIMQMDEGLDTGDVLLREDYNISPDMNAGDLHDTLANIAAPMILQTLDGLNNGSIKPQKQSEDGITYAKKIEKDDFKINWNHPARDIYNQIRGLAPKPGAYFMFNGEAIKVLDARLHDSDKEFEALKAGMAIDNQLTVKCGIGAIGIVIAQRPSKPPMPALEMLKGFSIPAGSVLK